MHWITRAAIFDQYSTILFSANLLWSNTSRCSYAFISTFKAI